jgi:hypothetical protein
MKSRLAVLCTGTLLVLLFSTRVPAPQKPDVVAQAPSAAGCPPEPPRGGISDVNPCVPYWALRSGSARNTLVIRELRTQLDNIEQRLSRLEGEE